MSEVERHLDDAGREAAMLAAFPKLVEALQAAEMQADHWARDVHDALALAEAAQRGETTD